MILTVSFISISMNTATTLLFFVLDFAQLRIIGVRMKIRKLHFVTVVNPLSLNSVSNTLNGRNF